MEWLSPECDRGRKTRHLEKGDQLMPEELTKTWDDARLRRDRLSRLQEQMKEQGLGALYLSDGVLRRYVLNIHVPAGGVFVPREGEALAFTRPRDMGYVKEQFANVRLPLYSRGDTREGTNPSAAKDFARGIAD